MLHCIHQHFLTVKVMLCFYHTHTKPGRQKLSQVMGMFVVQTGDGSIDTDLKTPMPLVKRMTIGKLKVTAEGYSANWSLRSSPIILYI